MNIRISVANQPMEPHILLVLSNKENAYPTSVSLRILSMPGTGNCVTIYHATRGLEMHSQTESVFMHGSPSTKKHVGDTKEDVASVYGCSSLRDMLGQMDAADGRGVSGVQLHDVVRFLNQSLACDGEELGSPIHVRGCGKL